MLKKLPGDTLGPCSHVNVHNNGALCAHNAPRSSSQVARTYVFLCLLQCANQCLDFLECINGVFQFQKALFSILKIVDFMVFHKIQSGDWKIEGFGKVMNGSFSIFFTGCRETLGCVWCPVTSKTHWVFIF